tara:strand:+ start:11294 stop:12064 length:771 start_codon:yes stop_codon:yes gene_type:complete
MSTIVNGRGIIKREENKNEVMSIEEYRALNFTPEEEWNHIYNPKRLSIEALDNIETRKRGKGDTKNVYTSLMEVDGKLAPYYDPSGTHIHIWKSHTTIPNLIGPQNANVPYIQFTDFKPGTYCCICHKLNRCHRFTWRPEPDANYIIGATIYEKGLQYSPDDYQKDVKYFPKTEPALVLKEEKYTGKWTNFMIKVLYSMNNDKFVYPVSKYKSLLLWPWEMTPYQKFKMGNPDYRKSVIFLEPSLEKFKDNYAYIE